MIRLLYGTGNPSKLRAMKNRLSELGIELMGLSDLNCDIPEVDENGKNPLENACKKAKTYYQAFGIPVFSCDSGLYIDELPEELQPGTHVRRINGKTLSDDEMIAYYTSLVQKYGRLTAYYRNAICLVTNSEHIYSAMDRSMQSAGFYIVDQPHNRREKGFPLDSISIDIRTGKYYYDLASDELDKLAVEDGFSAFFKKYLLGKSNGGE